MTTQESSGAGVRPPRPEKRLCAETVGGRSQALHPLDLGEQDSPSNPRATHNGQDSLGTAPRPHETTSLDAATPSEATHTGTHSAGGPEKQKPKNPEPTMDPQNETEHLSPTKKLRRAPLRTTSGESAKKFFEHNKNDRKK